MKQLTPVLSLEKINEVFSTIVVPSSRQYSEVCNELFTELIDQMLEINSRIYNLISSKGHDITNVRNLLVYLGGDPLELLDDEYDWTYGQVIDAIVELENVFNVRIHVYKNLVFLHQR